MQEEDEEYDLCDEDFVDSEDSQLLPSTSQASSQSQQGEPSRSNQQCAFGYLLNSAKSVFVGKKKNGNRKYAKCERPSPASAHQEFIAPQDPVSDSTTVSCSSKMSISSADTCSMSTVSSQSESVLLPEQNKPKLFILNGQFFEIIAAESGTKNVAARCQSCSSIIKGDRSSSSNFLRHLKIKHPATYSEYSKNQKDKMGTTLKEQSLITEFVENISMPRTVNFRSQQEFDNAIQEFVIGGFHSLSIVEESTLQKLFTYPLMSRHTLTRRLEAKLERLRDKIQKIIADGKYFSTSADFWSYTTKSYLGVVLHYIDKTYKRHTVPIAFKMTEGSHTFDRICQWMSAVYQKYELVLEKHMATTTDNASNFGKSFRQFGVTPACCTVIITQEEEEEEEAEENMIIMSEEIIFESIQSSDLDVAVWSLPPHFHCPSHKLSLVSSVDFLKIINVHAVLKEKHGSLMSKSNKLWKAVRRPLTAEVIKSILGVNLKYPVITRWNSIYDSLVHVLHYETKLIELIDKLNANKKEKEKFEFFSVADVAFLKFFVTVMKPIATALDILQADTMFGEIGPAIHSLYQYLDQMSRDSSNKISYKMTLIEGLKKTLMDENRFGDLLNLNLSNHETKVAVLAAVSHPALKNRFIRRGCPVSVEVVNGLFFEALKELDEKQHIDDSATVDQSSGSNFFILSNDVSGGENGSSSSDDAIKIEMLTFLKDTRTKLNILDEYKRVRGSVLQVQYSGSIISSCGALLLLL